MNISVLGTGMVGQVVSSKMNRLGHKVYMGTRDVNKTTSNTEPNKMTGTSFADWMKEHPAIAIRNYQDLPSETNLFINATNGSGSLSAFHAVGKEKLSGKTILDLANPLDFSQGMPPHLSVCNSDSLGEQLQREFPESNVVKSLNTMNCQIMMDPAIVQGPHNVFVSGNNAGAKAMVIGLLESIGWTSDLIIDLGDIGSARGTEMMLPVWLRLYGVLGNANFNFHIQKK